jgi:hypothetical protein
MTERTEPPALLQSDLLSRVSSFLPQINAANDALLKDGDAAALVDVNLQAVDSSSDSSAEGEGDDDESSSEESSSSEDGKDGDSDHDGGEEKSVPEERPSKKAKRKPNPTVVMNLQLGALDDNPVFGMLADDDSDDEECEEEEDAKLKTSSFSTKESTIQNLLTMQKAPPSHQPKGPLITEVPDER